jgi:hypothetical protein
MYLYIHPFRALVHILTTSSLGPVTVNILTSPAYEQCMVNTLTISYMYTLVSMVNTLTTDPSGPGTYTGFAA